MNISSPEVTVHRTDHIGDGEVVSRVTLKFVYPDGRVALVHLTADKAMELGIQMEFVAAEVKPELMVW